MITQNKNACLKESFERYLFDETDEFFKNLKQNSFEELQKTGIPNNKTEEWKYINSTLFFQFIEGIQNKALAKQNTNHKIIKESIKIIKENIIPEYKNNTLIIYNGKIQINESSLSENIIYGSFKEAKQKYSNLFDKYFNKGKDKDFSDLLNTSFLQDSLFLHIPAQAIINEPIQIIYFSDTNNFPHLNIISDKNSQAQIIIHTLSEGNHLSNIINEIHLEENAKLEVFYIQNESKNSAELTNTYCELQKNTILNFHNFALGSNLAKHKIIVNLEEAGSECNLNGLYSVYDNNQIHNQIILNHNKPNCSSSQLYKGILHDNGYAEFSGKIFVSPNSIGTNAKQLNRNLLISPSAKIDTRPQLEIQADDVKCSHGATIGQLEDEQIFYLLSRGINLEEAKKILINGFAEEIIQKVNLKPLKKKLDELLNLL